MIADSFDFQLFLYEYSKAIYESLLLFLYMDRNGYTGFSQKQFNELSALQYRDGDINDNAINVIQRLTASLSKFIAPLKVQYDFELKKEQNYYAALGMAEENAYLHFRGHNLYNIVLSIGKHLCKGSNIDFEYDILLSQLDFDTYWEINRGGKDLVELKKEVIK